MPADRFSIANHRFTVTFFPDKRAGSKTEEQLTLDELAVTIEIETRRQKQLLPWLKLAIFGDEPSPKGCLRHNNNMLELTGIEVEHDAGTMGIVDAWKRMKAAGVRCLLYTSPSYIAVSKEKWRILAPLSEPEPATLARRLQLAARLNGILDGAAEGESFSHSQAYYFGSINSNPEHRAIVVDGEFLDCCDDLDAGAIGKPERARKPHDRGSTPPGVTPGRDEAEIHAKLEQTREFDPADGKGLWHNSMLEATASMVGKGWSDERIYQACEPYCPEGMYGTHGVDEMIDSAREKWDAPNPGTDWSTLLGPGLDLIASTIKAPADHMFGRSGHIKPADFFAYMDEHKYIYIPTRRLWPPASVNARLGKIGVGEGAIKASVWLDKNRHVAQITWAPGEPMEIRDRHLVEGGWVDHKGIRSFNMYRGPERDFVPGDISPWRDHLARIYPDDAEAIELWCAHRAQMPAEKINHALVLGGRQGIGKDTILEPLRHAVCPWNFGEVNPVQMMARFNGFLKSVVLRISEVRDRGETDRYAFYNHTKIIIAAPPDTLLLDEKNTKEYRIPNVCGVVMTLNEKGSMYLPADDRRHYVAWSEASKTDFDADYWVDLWAWYRDGGLDAVAHHLMTLDLAGFDAKRAPAQTIAFHDIVALSQTGEDAAMADALDALGRPDAVTIADVITATRDFAFSQYMSNPGNSKKVGHRFEECGYSAIRNPDSSKGQWRLEGRRQAIFARSDLDYRERVTAAQVRANKTTNVVALKPKTPQ